MGRREELGRVDQALTQIARVAQGRAAALYRAERSGVFLSRPAIRILATLRIDGPMRLSDLARSADLEAPLISREIRGLADDGYVSRQPDPTDGRAGIVALTDKGRRASEAYRAAADEIIAETFSRWSTTDLRDLAAQLERVLGDFTRPVSRPGRRSTA